MMLFHDQNMVHFSKANFDLFAYVPAVPNTNYEDEAVFFTNDDTLTDSSGDDSTIGGSTRGCSVTTPTLPRRWSASTRCTRSTRR
jgi:hypothetical protein